MNIPGYRIESEIGKGGMATVYLATQESLERKVALKVMSPSLAADRTFCTRFLKEGKIIAQLKHPNIVTIFDIGCHESLYYMAIEYVGGTNLKQRIQQGLPPDEAVDVLRHVASALGYAHARGFIHRDVKSANVLFHEDGTPVLSDFGIAKTLSADEQLTRIGYSIGTPEYMSPEQALGRDVDHRTDIYSLGVVFYEMLTRRKPFVGRDAFATALMHSTHPVPELPEQFRAYQPILERMLAKESSDRFPNAEELVKAVERRTDRGTVTTQAQKENDSPSTRVATRSFLKGHRLWSIQTGWKQGVGFTLAAVVVFGAVYLYTSNPELASWRPDQTRKQSAETFESVPTQASSSLSSAEQEKVARLLEVAEAHAAVGRFRTPPGSNAYDAYQLVLDIDPTNEKARAGLKQIEEQTDPPENAPQ